MFDTKIYCNHDYCSYHCLKYEVAPSQLYPECWPIWIRIEIDKAHNKGISEGLGMGRKFFQTVCYEENEVVKESLKLYLREYYDKPMKFEDEKAYIAKRILNRL